MRVRVTSTSISKDLEESPYYPSLLSISNAFDRYRISNGAYEIPGEELEQLDTPYIAFVYMPAIGKDFIVVTKMTGETVSYLYQNRATQTISKKEFLKRYRRIVLIAEPDQNSGEVGFKEKRAQELKIKQKAITKIGGILSLIFIAIAINLAQISYWTSYLLIILIKLAGVAATISILAYEIDKNNLFVGNICRAGKQINCTAVLGSKGSKIFGISWAEIGVFYFASTGLWLLVPTIAFLQKIVWIEIANALAVPYIVYSIYYQWRIVKQWCLLCLTVQLLLFFEFLWNLENFLNLAHLFPVSLSHNFSTNYPSIIFCILAPVVVWYNIKIILTKSKDANLFAAAYRRLQNNPDIFKSLLQQQAKAPDGWENLGINVGNINAKNTIIKICNPYCRPCAAMHSTLEEIIQSNKNIRLKIIFITENSLKDKGAIVVKHLLAIETIKDPMKTQQALDDWYLAEQKDYEVFAAKYPFEEDLENQSGKIEAMANWCKEAEIPHTPTIFVNGYRLPENYEIKELKNIL
ncbi:MAG TPA: vitamin K epoxide reductase family protein [Puia sp.]|nr:vitamin K epoxide reductase family protein [Puia sp.]